jgi:hypothetical protein
MKASHFFQLLMGTFLVGYFATTAAGEVVDLSRVASLLEYPVNKLTVSDLAQEWQNQYGKDLLFAYKINSSDRTFAPMIITISVKGLILSKELEKEINTSLRAVQIYPQASNIMRKVDFREDAYGYVFSTVGPGGSEQLVFATLPRQNRDLLVKVTIPGEDPLAVTSETEAYHRLISEGGDRLTGLLIECAEATIAEVAMMSPLSVQQTPVQTIPQAASSVVSSDELTPPLESSDPRSSPAVEAEPSKSTPWPWIIGAILLLAAAGGILFKFRRK